MLLWEIDRPLRDLTALYGFDRAARAYRASLEAVQGLRNMVARLALPCRMRDKNSLYLAAGDSDRDLREEHDLRCRAGLPGDFLDHRALLETFDIARAAESSGSGLGLSITKAIVERHGGTIRVTSQPGETTFTVVLPQSPGA